MQNIESSAVFDSAVQWFVLFLLPRILTEAAG